MENHLLKRITLNQDICHGKPCIRGLRYPVSFILELLSSGSVKVEEILEDYDDLEAEDIQAVLLFAARLSKVKIPMDYRNIITIEPGKRGRKPCIRRMRITVYDVLVWLAAGMSHAEILEDFPELTETDIKACLAFAADREHRLVKSVSTN